MAQQITASVYGKDNNPFAGAGGYGMTFPTQGVSFLPVPNGTNFNGALIYGIVKVWIAKGEPEYYTNKTVASLLSDSNT